MQPDEGRDEEVMAEVARGRSHLLERLIRRHATPLLTFIRRLVGDRHHSEEVFQDVFLAVWAKRNQYEYPRSFKNWLYAIALNRCREMFRARGLPEVPLAEQDTVALSEGAPEEAVIAAETADTVSQAVLALPPQQRAVVTLRVWENLPYPRIARIVGCSEATARSHMHLGLVTLRRVLKPRLGGQQITGERSP
jgi:RNA polymerase sigma-70 factor (ECF subfamily)